MNLFPELSTQVIQVYNNLSDIYAGIEDELCSKQSILMNKLKNNFSALYSNLLPSHFVIVNHVLSLSNFAYTKILTGLDFKIAIQNGINLLVRQTYLGGNIFINGLEEKETVFDFKGTLIVQSNQVQSKKMRDLKADISQIIRLANDSLSLSKLSGGVILIYPNIHEGTQFYREKILLAFFFAILIINSEHERMSLYQIYQKLYQCHLFSNSFVYSETSFLENQFMPFSKCQLVFTKSLLHSKKFLTHEPQQQNIELSDKQKLLFFDLRLTEQELSLLKRNHQQNQVLASQFIAKQTQKQKRNIHSQIQITNLYQEFNQSNLSFSYFISWLTSKTQSFQIPFHSPPAVILNKLNSIFEIIGKQFEDYFIYQNYLVLAIKSKEIYEKFRLLRKFISTPLPKNSEILQQRFSGVKGIDKIMFSSSSCRALAILNPEKELWFK